MFLSAIAAIIVALVFPAAAIAQQITPTSGEEWYKVATARSNEPPGFHA